MESSNQNLQTPTPPVPMLPTSKKWYQHKGILAIIILAILVVLASWAYFAKQNNLVKNSVTNKNSAVSDFVDTSLPNDPLVGTTVVFNEPLVYTQDCTGCYGSVKELQPQKEVEINRSLQCPYEFNATTGGYLYKDGYINASYVPSNMQFTVTEVFSEAPDDVRVAVLKDSNSLLSTALAEEVQSKQLCINPVTGYLDKLLRYSETAGKVHIELALYNVITQQSDSSVQEKFIKSLPSKYTFANVKTVDSTFVPGLVGVDMDVDSNALAFLIASEQDLKVWAITGLDPAYQAMLNSTDIAKMSGAPIGKINPPIDASLNFTGTFNITFATQKPGRSVIASSVTAPLTGFVVITRARDQKVIGNSSLLQKGETKTNLVIPVNVYLDRDSFYATFVVDNGDGKFDSTADKVAKDENGFPAISMEVSVDTIRTGQPHYGPDITRGVSSLILEDQLPGTEIVVENVPINSPAFIVIQKDNNGALGDVLGVSPLQTHSSSNLSIQLSQSVAGQKLFAVMYQDAGSGTFDVKTDQIVKGVGNAPIQVEFNVLSQSDLK